MFLKENSSNKKIAASWIWGEKLKITQKYDKFPVWLVFFLSRGISRSENYLISVLTILEPAISFWGNFEFIITWNFKIKIRSFPIFSY